MDTVKLNPDMPEGNKCPHCGTPLPAGTLAGLCPACLLALGAAEDTATEGRQPAFTPPAIPKLAPLFPQLEILELIGKGGMGAVYKARQKQLDRIVALKILPPGIGDDPAFAERFAREAKALAKLNHPGIVTLYEFGASGTGVPPVRFDAGGDVSSALGDKNYPGHERTSEKRVPLYFFLMEFVDGVNLRQLLHSGRVSPREALAIVPQICDALQFAHDHGIVHRDIKPENILLDRRGRVKVADFGLAKIVGGNEPLTPSLSPSDGERVAGRPGEGTPTLTDAGKVMGTPNYMAPEQVDHPADVDHRADIYALGVVFYQMLTGELPGKPLQPPSNKVHIDVRLDEVVLRALERNPELRFQQVSEVKTYVETIVNSGGVGVPRVPPALPAEPAVSPSNRRDETQSEESETRNPKPEIPPRFQARRVVIAILAGLIVGLLTLVAATAITSMLPDSFQATTRLKLDRLATAGLNPSQPATGSQPAFGYDPYFTQTEFAVMQSELVLDRVIETLDLNTRWSGRYGHGEPLDTATTTSLLLERMSLRPVRNTSLIELSLFSEIPTEAAELANAIADSYIGFRQEHVRVRIIERAQPPVRPSRPNRPLNLLLGAIIALVLGLVVTVATFLWLYLKGKDQPPDAVSSAAAGNPADSNQPTQSFSPSQTPWQIWVVVALLALEGLGNLLSIPRQPAAAVWLIAKVLFVTGLLLRWRPVFVLVLLVSVIHVWYFAFVAPLVGLLNLVLLILVASTFRYYFHRDASQARTPSISDQATMLWLKIGAWLVWLAWLPVMGFGTFFLYALFSERGEWHPNPTEAVVVPLFWLGSLLLPLFGWLMFRAARRLAGSSAAHSRGFGLGVALLGLALVLVIGGTAAVALYGSARSRQAEATARRAEAAARAEAEQVARAASTKSLSFGPAMELTINRVATGTNALLRFKTGELVSPPPETNNSRQAVYQWAHAHDADAAVGVIGADVVSGFDMVVVPAPAQCWDELTPDQAVKRFGAQPRSSFQIMSYGQARDFPETCVFRTREGGIGILQVLQLVSDPPGLRVRFKYLAHPPTVAPIIFDPDRPESWSPELLPGEKPDVAKILEEAKELTGKTRYAEALARFVWFHNHAQKYGDSYQTMIRRLGGLSEWVELGRRYPRAKAELLEIRDAKSREFTEGRGYADLFDDVASINQHLDDEGATCVLFQSVAQHDATLARQCYGSAEAALKQCGEYALCLSYLGDPQAKFESLRQNWKRTPVAPPLVGGASPSLPSRVLRAPIAGGVSNSTSPLAAGTNLIPLQLQPVPLLPARPDMSQWADNYFVGQVCNLIEILVGAGRKADAEKIRDQAVALLNDARLNSALEDAEAAVRKVQAAPRIPKTDLRPMTMPPGNAASTNATRPSAFIETWAPELAPGAKPDLDKVRQEANDFMTQTRYEEALQRHIWYHNHVLEYHPGPGSADRLATLSDWVELSRRYFKAKQALVELRDSKTRELAEGRGYSDLFQELWRLNQELQDEAATLSLFKTIQETDPALARQCYYFVEELLMGQGEYELCLSYLGEPQKNFESARDSWQRLAEMEQRMEELRRRHAGTNSPPPPSSFSKHSERNFVNRTCRLIEILVGAGRKAEAEKIRDQAVAVLSVNVPELQSAVSDTENKIRSRQRQPERN